MNLVTLQFKLPYKMHYCQHCGKTFSRKFTLCRHIKHLHAHKVVSRNPKRLENEAVPHTEELNSDTDTTELTSNNYSSSEKVQEGLHVLNSECIKMFQKIVLNGEIGKVKITRRTLVDLIGNLKFGQVSDENVYIQSGWWSSGRSTVK